MIGLSDQSKRLVSTFLTYRNDVDIYTEDQIKDKEFYRVLFGRLIDSRIKINDITPLGSKSNLIARCKNEPPSERKKIFIVDGDIQLIHGENIPTFKNLFVLDAYCIENFLFDKENIIQFIYLHSAVRSKEEIENEVDYGNWLSTFSDKLIDLFIHFAIVDLFGGAFTLYNIQRFCEKNIFNDKLVDETIEKLKFEILFLTSRAAYDAKYAELKSKWTNSLGTLLTIVSGKDYLIPILLIKTQTFKKSKALPSIEEVKFQLVQNCNLNRLSSLKDAIEHL